MYKDMAVKMRYHKEKIIQGFIDLGVFPTDERIQELLDSIDMSTSYLNVEEAVPGKDFDTEAYNAMFLSIYKDLELLYKLLFELAVEEYTLLTSFVDTHINNLEATMDFYKEKATQETNTTSLGNTIFFKNHSFNTKIQNNITHVDLGNVSMHRGSRIASIFNANDIEGDKVIFSFKKGNDTLRATPYNYNYATIVVPGETDRNEFDFKLEEDQIIDGMIKMNINKEPSMNNVYTILGAKDKVLVKQFGELTKHQIKNRPTKFDMLGFSEKSYIDFYTVGTNSVTFRFNKKPISTNFSLDSYVVNNLNYIHHFFIECDAGFSFDFDIDGGQVFALKETGLIVDKELYFPKNIEAREFKIIEYELGDKETYAASVDIINDDGDPVDIKSIMIKELLTMEDDHNDSL